MLNSPYKKIDVHGSDSYRLVYAVGQFFVIIPGNGIQGTSLTGEWHSGDVLDCADLFPRGKELVCQRVRTEDSPWVDRLISSGQGRSEIAISNYATGAGE